VSVEAIFLNYAADKLVELQERIETCLGKLPPEQVWARHAENENAVGNLVLHLEGNVRQWILSGVGGEPDVRARDAEFDARGGLAIAELEARLRLTVDKAIQQIRTLSPARLTDPLTIQGYQVTVLGAIFHVVEHFSGHTAQIIFATKFLTGEDLGFYAHLSAHTKELGA
jgi:uncharacterized damage-inducible protein DinB